MKFTLLMIGKSSFPFIREGISMYEKRINHYIAFEIVEIPDIKGTASLSKELVKAKEGTAILKKIKDRDEVVLLDEKGKMFSSLEWAHFLETRNVNTSTDMVFVIGGAYGFSQEVYQRADSLLSLSKMTFSHQIIRLSFTEQLYRAMTIIKGEPYHNE